MRRRTLCAGFFFLLAAVTWGQEPAIESLSGEAKVAELIQRVSEAQSSLKTLTARFEQHKESRLLTAPSVSRGEFYFRAPNEVCWRYTEPRVMQVVITGGVAVTYRPAEKRAERVEIGRMQRKVFNFLSATEPLDRLTRYFSVTLRDPGDDRNFIVELNPTSFQIKRRLTSVTVEIDRHTYLPVSFAYVEKDGDRTAYAFSDVKIDPAIPADTFALKLPADVKVVEIKLGSGD